MYIKINDITSFATYKKEIEKIANLQDGKAVEIKELVAKRMAIKKDFKMLEKTFSKQSLENFSEMFFKVFKLDFDSYRCDSFNEVSNNDLLKAKVIAKLNNNKLQTMQTDMVVEKYTFIDHVSYKSNNAVIFKVLCDQEIDPNKIYSKKEVLKLYKAKKLIIVDFKYAYTNQKANLNNDFKDFYPFADEYNFPSWYEQPLAMSIIKVDPRFRKMMVDEYNKYAEESKKLANQIKEVLPNIVEREKQQMEKKNEKALLEANKKYEIDIKKAKQEYENVVKKATKILKDKENKARKEEKERQKAINLIETYIK